MRGLSLLKWSAFFCFLMLFSSCNDALEEEIASIKSELKEQKEILMSLKERTTITGIKELDGMHVIEFSDGQKIEIKDGYTPMIHIGENGNWFIDNQDSGVRAVAQDGVPPSIVVGPNDNWWINGEDIGVPAVAKDGETPTVEIDENGYWVVNGEDTGIQAHGKDGLTPHIEIDSLNYWVINGENTGIRAEGIDGMNGMDGREIINVIDGRYNMEFVFSDSTSITVNKAFAESHIQNFTIPFEPDTLRILGIGNSFTIDGMNLLAPMAYMGGDKNVVMGTLEYGSSSLQDHLNALRSDTAKYGFRVSYPKYGYWKPWYLDPITIKEALQYTNWDIVVLQQVSQYSGLYNTYQPYLNELIDEIRMLSGNARLTFAWQMTWAYDSLTTHPGFEYYHKSQQEMYERIVEATHLMKQESGIDVIIPSGAIIQELRETYPDIAHDITLEDGVHLDYGLSRYAVAAAWYEILIAPAFRKTILGNPYETYFGKLEVNSDNRDEIQRIVKRNCIEWRTPW